MPFPITCTACGKTFSIADDVYERKVKGRVVTIKCKQCQAGIRIDDSHGSAADDDAEPLSVAQPEHLPTKAQAPQAAAAVPKEEPRQAPKAEPPKAEPPKAEPPKAEPPKAEPPKAEPPNPQPAMPAAAVATTTTTKGQVPSTAKAATAPATIATRPQVAPLAPRSPTLLGISAPKAQHLAAAAAQKAEPAAALPRAQPAPAGAARAQPVAAASARAQPAAAAPKATATPIAAPVAVRASAVATPTATPKAEAAKLAPTPAAVVPPEPAPEILWAVDYPDGQDRELTGDLIRKELAAGTINETTLVWREGMAEWLELGQVAELRAPAAPPAQRAKAPSAPGVETDPQRPRGAPGPLESLGQRPRGASSPGLPEPALPPNALPAATAPTEPAQRPRAPSAPIIPEPAAQRPRAPSAPVIPEPAAQRPRAPARPAPAPIPKSSPAFSPFDTPFDAPKLPPSPAFSNAASPIAALIPAAFPASPAAAATPLSPAPSFSPAQPLSLAAGPPLAGVDEWPQPKKRTPLIIGVVLGILAIGGVAFFLLGSSRETPSPPAPITALPATAPTTAHPSAEPTAAADPSPASDNPTGPGASPHSALDQPRTGPVATPNAGFAELFASGARQADEKHGVNGPTQRFDANAAKAALTTAAASTPACREKGGPAGKATIVVTFEPSGKVSSATVSDAPFAGTSSGACIAAAMKRATVPAFSGLPGTVTKTISLQ